MNRKTAMVLLVAVVCGLGAMVVVMQMGGGDGNVEMQEVLVAAADINPEEFLKPTMVKVISAPRASVPPGTFVAYKDVEDRWVKIKVLEGEAIVDRKLGGKGEKAGLIARISEGKRAFTINVNEQSGVSGFVQPENHVDVIQAKNGGGGPAGERGVAETVLEDLLVLASGTSLLNQNVAGANQARTVTLEVTPDEAKILTSAQSQGQLSLALRAQRDRTRVKPPAALAMRDMVVATVDINADEFLRSDMARVISVPQAEAPAGAFAAPKDVEDRQARVRIAAGQPLVEAKLTEKGAPDDPMSRLPSGMRAFAFNVDEQTGVSGFIRPLDHVDILSTAQPDRPPADAKPTPVSPVTINNINGIPDPNGWNARQKATAAAAERSPSSTLIEDVLVLANPKKIPGAVPVPGVAEQRTITVALTPEQVARLLDAQTKGKITLSLRPKNDHSLMVRQAPPKRPPVEFIWIYRGGRGRTLVASGGMPQTSGSGIGVDDPDGSPEPMPIPPLAEGRSVADSAPGPRP